MSRPEHPLWQEELMAYVDDQLQPEQAADVARHLETCQECTSAVEEARQLSRQMASWEVEESPSRVAERVLGELQLQHGGGRRKPWWSRGRVWGYGFAGAFVALVLMVFVATPSLLRSRQAATGGQLNVPFPASMPPSEVQVAGGPEPSQAIAVPGGPMVIRNFRLALVAREFDIARSQIDSTVGQLQGYVDQLHVRGEAGAGRTLSAVLRLPADRLDAGVNELKKLGKVKDESQSTTEVTSQYVDLVARLTNARNSEQRLLSLMRERAGNLKDVVEMEREIMRVREEIERMEAQRKDISSRVQYATITLEMTEEYRAQIEPSAPSARTRIQNALVEGYESLVETLLGLVLFALRFGPVLLLWGVVLSFGFLAARKLHRKII